MTNSKKTIRCAIIGVGNCAKSLVEGVAVYSETGETAGLAFPDIGGYSASNVKFVLAYDVDKRKVGKSLSDALYEDPNCAITLAGVTQDNLSEVAGNVVVKRGALLDGVAPHMLDHKESESFRVSDDADPTLQDIIDDLVQNDIDVVINYLPVGSEDATRFYVEACLAAKVPFVNCIPVFIVSDPVWQERLIDAGIPAIGDDMRSAVGASIISAALQELFIKRGATVTMHYQDNVGGNTDFLNMQDKGRLTSKKISKENVIIKQNEIAGVSVDKSNIHAGPAQYFSDLGDNKRAHWLIRGTIFGGAKFEFTADLSCQDSPNSAGVVIDAIRFLQVARDLGIVGSIFGPSAWTQKSPPLDMRPGEAYEECSLLAAGQIPHNYVLNEAGQYVFKKA